MTECLHTLQRIDHLLQTYCVGSLCHGVLGSNGSEQPSQSVAVLNEDTASKLSLEQQKTLVSVIDGVISVANPLRITVDVEHQCVCVHFTNTAQLIVLIHVVEDNPTSYTCYLRPTVTRRVYTTNADTIEDMKQIGQTITQFSKFKWCRGLNENVEMDGAVLCTDAVNITDERLRQIVDFLLSGTLNNTINIKVNESRGFAYTAFPNNVELFILALKAGPSSKHSECYIRLDKSDDAYVAVASNINETKQIWQIVNNFSLFTWTKGQTPDERMSDDS